MTIGIDRESWQGTPAGDAERAGPDWIGLRARLAAAYAARARLFGGTPLESSAPAGSFDRRCARVMAIFGRRSRRRLEPINPAALGNGKSTSDNSAAVAGAPAAGD